MDRTKKIAGILSALGIFMLSGTGILGYWKITGNTGNILTMASFKNQIEEEYHVPSKVDPGQTVDKVVNVANTGTTDSMIRIRIKKMFGDIQNGAFIEDTTLNPEMIQIQCDTEMWKYRPDGYYYYADILKAGSKTKKPLFQAYTLSAEAGNEYKKKAARIIVMLESIQAQDAVEDIWRITWKDLGITRPEAAVETQTEVIYLGQRGGFQITEKDTDLFASFKNLTPGCARTQTIYVENKSSEEVQMYLRAEATDQKSMDAHTAALVKDLLEKYAVIEVSTDQGSIYRGSVSGNLNGSGSTMKNDLYLGTFKGKEKKKLLVKLALSEDMDNEFCKLTGKVRWVFTAKGEDGKTVASGRISSPSTGDNTEIGMWIALLGFSALFLTAAFMLEKSYSRKEQNEVNKRNP